MMRSISTFFGIINYILIYLHLTIGKRFMNTRDNLKFIFIAIVISSYPLIFFYNFLYYTDSASLTVVLLMFYLQRLRSIITPVVGLISILFRQTNVIWVFFCYIMEVLELIRRIRLRESSKWKDKRQTSLDIISAIREIFYSIKIILSHFIDFMSISIGYIIVIILFILFVYINGGITVGDRSAHKPFFHFPQIIYFFGSFGLSLFPVLLEYNIRRNIYLRHILKLLTLEENTLCIPIPRSNSYIKKLLNFIISILSIVIMLFCIFKFTYAHPYLVSDNRHYTFYLWRLYNKFSFIKYASIIPSHFILFTIFHMIIYSNSNKGMLPITSKDDQSKALKSIAQQYRLIWLIATIILICSVTIPSPLLEPRYFVIPYIILSLAIINSTEFSISMVLIGIFYIIINIITIYIFLYKPYPWPNENEPIARFMW